MKYFAAFLAMLDPEKSKTLRPQHLDHLASAFKAGKIFASGKFADGAGGLIIYQTETAEEALELAQKDPYVVEGARRLDMHEWEIAH